MDAVADNDRAEIRHRLHVVRKTHYAAPSAGGIGMKCFCGRMGAVNTDKRGVFMAKRLSERSAPHIHFFFLKYQMQATTMPTDTRMTAG